MDTEPHRRRRLSGLLGLASLACLGLNLGLLRYLYGIER